VTRMMLSVRKTVDTEEGGEPSFAIVNMTQAFAEILLSKMNLCQTQGQTEARYPTENCTWVVADWSEESPAMEALYAASDAMEAQGCGRAPLDDSVTVPESWTDTYFEGDELVVTPHQVWWAGTVRKSPVEFESDSFERFNIESAAAGGSCG
jgi:hypothetical protein